MMKLLAIELTVVARLVFNNGHLVRADCLSTENVSVLDTGNPAFRTGACRPVTALPSAK